MNGTAARHRADLKQADAVPMLGDMFDKSARIDLTCPNCQHRWAVTLGDLRTANVRCPDCRGEIDTKPFAKRLDDAEKRLKRGFR